MNNENIVINSVTTAKDISNSLSQELESFIEGLPIINKQKSLENDFTKIKSLIDAESVKLSEIDKKINDIQKQINLARPDDLPSLSKQKAKINYSRIECMTVLGDLSERKEAIEAELKKIEDSLKPEILRYLRAQTKKYEKQIQQKINTEVEPIIVGWDTYASNTARQLGFGPSRYVEFKLYIYSPLLEKSCKNTLRPPK